MSISFQFYLDGSRRSNGEPNFSTGLAEIGEAFLHSPEAYGFKISPQIRAKIAEIFPCRGQITAELAALQAGNKSTLLAQIPGLQVKYDKRY